MSGSPVECGKGIFGESRSRRAGEASVTASKSQRAELALRDIAMAYPEAHEDFPWGERAIKIKGKVFVFLHANAEQLSLTTKLPASSEMALLLPYV